jgi:hypothetical protein
MLRILHCPDNQLRDGGKVVSPTHRPGLKNSFHKSGNTCIIGNQDQFARSEVSTAVTMKNTVFLDVIQCGSCC